MQIFQIKQSDIYNNMPVFKSTGRCVFGADKSIICNYTKFFREDLDWKHFVNLLSKKYRDVSKVNVFNLACSDGSEPLSLMTVLVDSLKEESQKFFPIYASDKDEFIISKAKSGRYNINDADLRRINTLLSHYSDYFSMTSASGNNFPLALKLLPEYLPNIIFKKSDILSVIDELPAKNNVVLCRNVLPYLDTIYKVSFVDKLAQKLDDSSLVVIGAYDNGHKINDLLRNMGFRQYEMENVYIKG